MTPLLLCPLHTATPDTTKQSCLCRVGRGGVNWTVLLLKRSDFNCSVGDSLELSRIQFTPPRQTRRGQDCFVWPGGVNSVSVLLSLQRVRKPLLILRRHGFVKYHTQCRIKVSATGAAALGPFKKYAPTATAGEEKKSSVFWL